MGDANIILANFFQQLHKNENIALGEGTFPCLLLLNPPMIDIYEQCSGRGRDRTGSQSFSNV